ncbi:hypothetical protein R1flu_026609 [Riccia fluitans]|uniref:F-box domain-containing protein n=1 Tax=Riccia fluitans TaxID=41844 RepID=A0ABD1XJE4_9MARC
MVMSRSEGGVPFTEGQCKRLCVEEDQGYEQMDIVEELIISLPTELVDKIVKKVPFEDLLKWRPVCRTWNRLIMSGAHGTSQFTHNIPVVYRFDRSTFISLAAYNASAGTWRLMDMSFLQPILSFERRTVVEYVTGGRLGLLFMACTSRAHREVESFIIVCNPVAQEYKELKVPDGRCRGYIWVISDEREERQHYNILVSYKDERIHHVYDSTSSAWKRVTGPPVDPCCIFSSVSINGCLYFLRKPRSFECHRYPTIGAYEPSSDTWSEMHGLPIHVGPDNPRLVETAGQLLYVARTFTLDKKIGHGRINWCFYKMRSSVSTSAVTRSKHAQWKLTRQMPIDVYSKLNLELMFAPIYREIRCLGEGDNIFFVRFECACIGEVRDGNRVMPSSNEGVRVSVVVHDFQRDTWTWLPTLTDPDARFWYWEPNSVRMISFRPSLAMIN